MAKYRKRPVVIEAMQWIGTNAYDILLFCSVGNREINIDERNAEQLTIKTLEGVMTASKGDYIIKGVFGEFYPCKPDVFEKTYEYVGVS